jgi:hypothetical protein
MKVSRNQVLWAFKTILGRDISNKPDNDPGIIAHQNLESLEKLVETLLHSDEFKLNNLEKSFEVINDLTNEKNKITIIQSHDADIYCHLGNLTYETILKYCRKNNLPSEKYIGIKKGLHPWHACFNRVYILKEMVDRGCKGWVLYMDTDSWVNDYDFKLKEYLEDKTEYAAIFSQAHDHWWCINNGVFLINLDHPKSRFMIDLWLNKINSSWIHNMNQKTFGHLHDQVLLHAVLKEFFSKEDFFFESYKLFNSSYSSFIRTALLAGHPVMESRISHVKAQIII